MIVVLLSFFLIALVINIYSIVQYVLKKNSKHLIWFIITASNNALLALVIVLLSLFNKELLYEINIRAVIWTFSGVIMLSMLLIKIFIFINIYKRSKDPDYFHYNVFGTKVLHSDVVKKIEIKVFMLTIPFFLFAGSYFIAQLVNLILYNRL